MYYGMLPFRIMMVDDALTPERVRVMKAVLYLSVLTSSTHTHDTAVAFGWAFQYGCASALIATVWFSCGAVKLWNFQASWLFEASDTLQSTPQPVIWAPPKTVTPERFTLIGM